MQTRVISSTAFLLKCSVSRVFSFSWQSRAHVEAECWSMVYGHQSTSRKFPCIEFQISFSPNAVLFFGSNFFQNPPDSLHCMLSCIRVSTAYMFISLTEVAVRYIHTSGNNYKNNINLITHAVREHCNGRIEYK